MSQSILIVEDDPTLGTTLKLRLSEENLSISLATNLKNARELLELNKYNLAIVDIGLPDGSGFDLAVEIKKFNIPIIFLTAQNTAEDRLKGFEIGAADYIPKPFLLQELLLRMRKILAVKGNDEITSGEITINKPGKFIVLPGSRKEFLNDRDFKALVLLIESHPNPVSRETMLEKFWPGEKDITPRTVDNLVLRLRIHLQEFGDRYIRSVRGSGYQWTEGTMPLS